MINELYMLSDAISKAGISPDEWHKELRELPNVSEKNPCYRIWLSAQKHTVDRIDAITDQDRANKLRKWEKDNGSSFPAFNLSALYRFKTPKELDVLSETERKIEKNKKEVYGKWLEGKVDVDINELKKWCSEAKANRDEQEITKIEYKIEKCLHRAPGELLKRLGGERAPKNALTDLIRILEKMPVKKFYTAIEQYIFRELKKKENVKLLLNLLFAEKQLSVILDLSDYESTRPVAHETTIRWINKTLIGAEKNTMKQGFLGIRNDAFGSAYTEVGETMPVVKLPGLGGVKLRSMFADHSCQKRYGVLEDTSYPITKENRAKIKKSLEWLSEEERKGKTWGLIEAKEIVFAYPSRILPAMPRLATLLGASGTASPEKFAECVESVFQILRGLPKEKQPENIHIFAIHKMDKARSKVVFYRTYTIKNLYESAKTWQAGGENIPAFDMWVWTDREKKGVKSSEKVTCERLFPRVPEPLETAKILNKVWKIDGTSAGEIPWIKYYQGIELFFSDLSERDTQHLLHVLLSNYEGLVHYVGNKTHKNHNAILSDKEKENCAVLFPFFGLLLYKQHCYKEEYMESMSYQIGQLLKIADELHALYCKVVRDGNVPPQLVGNSLFVAAGESPVQALAQLSPRICPYIAWAKQYRTKKIEEKDKESWKAAWYVRLFEDIANTLRPYITDTVHLGRRLSDLEKAQFFIGYLASVPKREKNNENSQEPKADNQGK